MEKRLATLLCKEDTKLLITFTDGAKTNGEEFLNGISSINNKVIIGGGMAGDNAYFFTQTFISCQNEILTSGAVGVSLSSSNLKVCNAYNFNWSSIGIEHTIDEVEQNRVYKISGLTPLDFL